MIFKFSLIYQGLSAIKNTCKDNYKGVLITEQKEYSRRCRLCSAIGHELCPEYLKVKYNNVVYIPVGYEVIFIKGKSKVMAKLKDIHANSVLYADINKVE